MKLPAYPRYKRSGIEWLGDIPEHWEAKRLKFLSNVTTSGVWGEDPELERDGHKVATTADIDMQGNIDVAGMNRRLLSSKEIEKGLCRSGDIIVVKSSGSATSVISGKAGLIRESHGPICFSNFTLRVRPRERIMEPRFTWFFLSSEIIRSQVHLMVATTTYPNLQVSEYVSFMVPKPSQMEQCAIADFLDAETAKLDTLVAKRRELIEKLKERRTALISRTVTRGLLPEAARAAGLNPSPKLKHSGIEWLGEIPESWNVVPLGYLIQFRGGATPDKNKPEFWDGTIPWVSPKDMKRPRISDGEDHISEEALRSSPLSMIPVRGVLIVVRGMILAHSFPVALVEAPVTINQDMKALLCGKRLHPEYLFWVLSGLAKLFVSFADESAHGTRKLETPVLSHFPFPLPSLCEQFAIAEYLSEETAKIDRMVEKVEYAIECLQEYSIALITAAVTGKIDVRKQAV